MLSRFSKKEQIVAATCVLAGVSIYTAFQHWSFDDPFITYRYAANIQSGLGFVYNPGEKVLSTTTPLFAVLLAALGCLWNDLPRLANLISAFGLALGAFFLWDLARALKVPLVGWAGYSPGPMASSSHSSWR
jgi:hypothetical protein